MRLEIEVERKIGRVGPYLLSFLVWQWSRPGEPSQLERGWRRSLTTTPWKSCHLPCTRTLHHQVKYALVGHQTRYQHHNTDRRWSRLHEMSRLESLPQELVESVAEHLVLDDLRHLRLTCRTLAMTTQPLLAQPVFQGHLWRDDIRRLYELSRLTPCASRIRSVDLNFSRLDEYRAVHDSFSFFYMMEPEIRSDILRDEWAAYFSAKRCADSLVASGTVIAPPLAVKALAALPGLTSLRLTWRDCPWPGPEMDRVFQADESAGMVSEREVEIQRLVLRWLWTSDAPLRVLEMDALCVPHGDISNLVRSGGPVGQAVKGLRVLRIRSGSKTDEGENDRIRSALALMVESMEELEVYELEGRDMVKMGEEGTWFYPPAIPAADDVGDDTA